MKRFSEETPDVRLSVSEANRNRIAVLEPVMEALRAFPRGAGKMEYWHETALRLAATYRPTSGTDCLSVKSLQRIYSRWRREGWRALALNYRGGAASENLPPAFVQFWKGLVLQFGVGRGVKQAHNELRRRFDAWRRGDASAAVPGFPECPPRVPGTELPAGWSYDNLKRARHLPTRAESVAAKAGMNAAREFRPPVCVRRAAKPGMVYQIDDMWHDHYASAPGFAAPVIPLQFGVLDEASACIVTYLIRPRLPRADGTNEQLQGAEMAFLLASLLADYGYHRDGCLLKVENGTAAVDADQEAVLAQISGGKIRVHRGAMLSGAAWDGGFSGQARGNFRSKAHIESAHSLIHNASSSVAAYRGVNRTVPEDTQGLIKARERMYRALEKAGFPQEVLDALSAGECAWNEFADRYAEIVDRLNARTDHDLADWEDNVVAEYRTDTNHDFAPVTSGTSRAVLSLVAGDVALYRTRKMSPAEVWRAGRSELVRVDAREAALLCRKYWTKVVVTDRKTVEFKERFSGKKIRYLARMRGETGVTDLNPGTTVFAFFNPLWSERGVLLFDADARFVGETVDEIERVDAADEDKIKKAIGVSEGAWRDAIRSVNAFMKPRRDERRERLAANQSGVERFFATVEKAKLEDARKRLDAVSDDDDFDGVLASASNKASRDESPRAEDDEEDEINF